MLHEYISSSELDFGDVVVNHCDPGFAADRHGGLTTVGLLSAQVYRLVAYALFANRLIVPSRYLLQPSMTYEALSTLSGLLEAGVIVPDLREGHYSFVEYLREDGVTDGRRIACARFLDEHASSVYSFDIKGESGLYHTRILEDLSEGGLLRSKLELEGGLASGIDALREAFAECEASRSKFEDLAKKYVPGCEHTIKRWAALRYYTCPAELMPRCIRDFPASVSSELRENHLSVPLIVSDPDEYGNLPQPMELSHNVLMRLPRNLGKSELALLSDAVLYVRDQVPTGSAKFATLAQQNFANNVEEVNNAFSDALAREERFANKTHSFILETLAGELSLPLVSWCLGYTFGGVDGAAAGVALAYALKQVQGQVSKRFTPFLETSEQLKLRTNRLFRSGM